MNGARKRTIVLSAFSALFGLGLGTAVSTSAIAGGDLGGNCCADLEERVAELEATAARKGNRRVSLQVYGHVNKAVMHFDDGVQSETYVVDNENSTSRFGFRGSAKIRSGWSAGYRFEAEYDSAGSGTVTAADDDGGGTNGALDIRLAYWWIKSERLGTLKVGQEWFATGDTAAMDLSGTGNVNNSFVADFGGGVLFRDQTGTPVRAFSAVVNEYDLGRGDIVRYDSPTFGGFTLSAAWGEDDTSDVALYYSGNYRTFQIAASIGGSGSNDEGADFEQIAGSISILHKPTGLNLTVAAGDRDTTGNAFDEDYVYVKGGLIRKRSLGNMAVSVSYYHGDEIFEANGDTKHWGLQIVQNIDAAAMELYAGYSHNEYKNATTTYQDIDIVMAGAKISF